MRAVVLILILLLLSIESYSHKRWRVGFAGSYNSTWLLNRSVRADPEISLSNTFSYLYGLSIKFNYRSWTYHTRHFGYTVEVLMNRHSQTYSQGFSGVAFDSRKTEIFYIDIPVLFRYTDDYIVNCEIGPQISILYLAYGDYVFDPQFTKRSNSDIDISSYYLPYNLSVLARLSMDIRLTNSLAFTPGIRFAYGVLDIISKKGKDIAKASPILAPEDIKYGPTRTLSAGAFFILSFRV
ncbi:outer membrane beta-barrel protein [Candidatus Amoebophilus asiaticus]|nr:outer membrane beta-barrel protein [Candidatus Amoebophilus asiaticus]